MCSQVIEFSDADEIKSSIYLDMKIEEIALSLFVVLVVITSIDQKTGEIHLLLLGISIC